MAEVVQSTSSPETKRQSRLNKARQRGLVSTSCRLPHRRNFDADCVISEKVQGAARLSAAAAAAGSRARCCTASPLLSTARDCVLLGPRAGIQLEHPSTPCQHTSLIQAAAGLLELQVPRITGSLACPEGRERHRKLHRHVSCASGSCGATACSSTTMRRRAAAPQKGRRRDVCALERFRSPAAVGGAPDDPRVTAWLACDPLAPLAMLWPAPRGNQRPSARPSNTLHRDRTVALQQFLSVRPK